ncbi:MAG: leucine--tRNA ligase [Abditibacteriota bacterium]|nr:leucine--tRNA ligase [Abditibacteriota bacterium]
MSDIKYDFNAIEKKWQERWREADLFRVENTTDKPKFYGLDFFPYPSGAGLSVGHCRNYIPTDVVCRYKRMNGFNVLHPMGWDAFGLPAENEAINKKSHPKKTVPEYINTYKRQMNLIGIGYDWSREVNSSSPEYYKWTQWIFELLYKRGLAYRSPAPANWCPHCATVLANEEVKDGKCWRCDSFIEKKNLPQWFFKITEYADRLISDLDTIDWPESIKLMQKNWIGRSEGAEVYFDTEIGERLTVYTTRPDTLWGATFMVIAPEHPLADKLVVEENRHALDEYRKLAQRQTAIERQSTEKEKTGIFTGSYAINPVNGMRIPIWVADYVMMGYGTGAIMAVPAHDDRDFDFAIKFGIPVIPVIGRSDEMSKATFRKGALSDDCEDMLIDEGIEFVEEANDVYNVTLKSAKETGAFIAIAKKLIQPGGHVSVVGARWTFIFEDAVIDMDSYAAERSVIERMRVIDKRFSGTETVARALASNPFLTDMLCHCEKGNMINSADFTGTPGELAKKIVIKWLDDTGRGKGTVNFKLRDWLISRQRYWGAPIPVIHCPHCGEVLVPEEDLPVLLPDVENYQPSASGESPLVNIPEFVNVKCPKCGADAKRETDTMGGFACSSWYFLRYASPDRDDVPFDKELAKYWLPVDLYVGGAEHAVMHLLYARFWTKVLYDEGLIDFVEPFKKLMNQGMVLAYTPHRTMAGSEGNEDADLIPLLPEQMADYDPDKIVWKYTKMSKSKKNVVTPDSMAEKFGADSLRLYELFVAPFEEAIQWSEEGMSGAFRFAGRVWRLVTSWVDKFDPYWRAKSAEEAGETNKAKNLRRKLHETIKKVGEDIDKFAFNTAVAALMELVNEMYSFVNTLDDAPSAVMSECVESLVLMMAPITPHMSDELWEMLGRQGFTIDEKFPVADESAMVKAEIEIIAQVNGKLRAKLTVPAGMSEADTKNAVLTNDKVKAAIEGKTVRKIIVVPNKLVNIVAN